MEKRYIIRLTEEEREKLEAIVKKLKGTSQKVKRANILKADANSFLVTTLHVVTPTRIEQVTPPSTEAQH